MFNLKTLSFMQEGTRTLGWKSPHMNNHISETEPREYETTIPLMFLTFLRAQYNASRLSET